MKSRTITSSAIADHSVRAALTTYADGKTTDNGIKIGGKANMIYTLKRIEIVIKGVLTTVVNNGGLFEFENSSVDWKPLEFYPNVSTVVGANAGAAMSPAKIGNLNVPLPVGSIVTVWYTAINAAIDRPYVTIFWEETPFGGKQTFSDAVIGAALTQVTIATNHVTVPIPATKGGNLRGILTQVYGTIETIVVSGGHVAVHNPDVDQFEPYQFVTGGSSAVGTGGAELKVEEHLTNAPAPAGSSFTFDYTPTDNQSQQLAVMLMWER